MSHNQEPLRAFPTMVLSLQPFFPAQVWPRPGNVFSMSLYKWTEQMSCGADL
jgi:hypothetical protein